MSNSAGEHAQGDIRPVHKSFELRQGVSRYSRRRVASVHVVEQSDVNWISRRILRASLNFRCAGVSRSERVLLMIGLWHPFGPADLSAERTDEGRAFTPS